MVKEINLEEYERYTLSVAEVAKQVRNGRQLQLETEVHTAYITKINRVFDEDAGEMMFQVYYRYEDIAMSVVRMFVLSEYGQISLLQKVIEWVW